jgi:hypothetical protein
MDPVLHAIRHMEFAHRGEAYWLHVKTTDGTLHVLDVRRSGGAPGYVLTPFDNAAEPVFLNPARIVSVAVKTT